MHDFHWLHFSDLHLSPREDFDTGYARNKLIECLSTEALACNYVFLTGDLADRGNYGETEKFVSRLLRAVDVPFENAFWSVGNHDISRSNELRNKLIHSFRNEGADSYAKALACWETRGLLTILGMKDYYENYSRLFHRNFTQDEVLQSHALYALDELNLIVLNTCLTSCDNEDPHNLFLMDRELLELLEGLDRTKPTFALGHHGKAFFATEEQKKLGILFDDMGVDVYLCGHAHRLGYERFDDAQRDIHQLTCGGGVMDRYSEFSFLHGHYCAADHTVQITPYSYFGDGDRNWNVNYHLHRRLHRDARLHLHRLETSAGGGVPQKPELTDHISSFAHYVDTEAQRGKLPRFGVYRDVSVPFCCSARQSALDDLKRFCDSEKAIEWWCITGKGGSGKSRLAWELCRHVQQQGWGCALIPRTFFEHRRFERITKWTYPRNLLLVIDYASHYAGEIAEWFELLCNGGFSNNLRILLIDRNAVKGYLEPLWLMELRQGINRDLLYETCFDTRKYSLELSSLSVEDSHAFLKNYLDSIRQPHTDVEIDRMIERWGKDEEYRQPLYLLFLAEAWSDTGSDTLWNITELQNHIYTKEINMIKARTKNEILESTARQLWAFATATSSFSILDTAIQALPLLECDRESIERHGMTVLSFQRLCREISGADQAGVDLAPYRPDIPGEYFVLREVMERSEYDPTYIKRFVEGACRYDPSGYYSFLERAIQDFAESDAFPPELFDTAGGLAQLPDALKEAVHL